MVLCSSQVTHTPQFQRGPQFTWSLPGHTLQLPRVVSRNGETGGGWAAVVFALLCLGSSEVHDISFSNATILVPSCVLPKTKWSMTAWETVQPHTVWTWTILLHTPQTRGYTHKNVFLNVKYITYCKINIPHFTLIPLKVHLMWIIPLLVATVYDYVATILLKCVCGWTWVCVCVCYEEKHVKKTIINQSLIILHVMPKTLHNSYYPFYSSDPDFINPKSFELLKVFFVLLVFLPHCCSSDNNPCRPCRPGTSSHLHKIRTSASR